MLNDIKTKRAKEQRKLMTLILFMGAALCFASVFIITDKDLKSTLQVVGAALFIGIFAARLFKGSFGYKPTQEEKEESQFGKQ